MLEHTSERRRIRTRGQGAGHTLTALTRPLPTKPEGGQAVQKPTASAYAFSNELAVHAPSASVNYSTKLAGVAR